MCYWAVTGTNLKYRERGQWTGICTCLWSKVHGRSFHCSVTLAQASLIFFFFWLSFTDPSVSDVHVGKGATRGRLRECHSPVTSGVLGVRFCHKIILSDTSSDSSPHLRKGEKHKLGSLTFLGSLFLESLAPFSMRLSGMRKPVAGWVQGGFSRCLGQRAPRSPVLVLSHGLVPVPWPHDLAVTGKLTT